MAGGAGVGVTATRGRVAWANPAYANIPKKVIVNRIFFIDILRAEKYLGKVTIRLTGSVFSC
jgi:hypothetical protein